VRSVINFEAVTGAVVVSEGDVEKPSGNRRDSFLSVSESSLSLALKKWWSEVDVFQRLVFMHFSSQNYILRFVTLFDSSSLV